MLGSKCGYRTSGSGINSKVEIKGTPPSPVCTKHTVHNLVINGPTSWSCINRRPFSAVQMKIKCWRIWESIIVAIVEPGSDHVSQSFVQKHGRGKCITILARQIREDSESVHLIEWLLIQDTFVDAWSSEVFIRVPHGHVRINSGYSTATVDPPSNRVQGICSFIN